jgi:uncharacterized protein with HEPN domain
MRLETRGALFDIHQAIQFIVDDTSSVIYDEFLRDQRLRQLVERNLTIIGEAINRLRRHDLSVAGRISDVSQIIAMRNVLIHAYDAIDYERGWLTIEVSLPVLLGNVELLLAEGEPEDAQRNE